MSKKVVKVRNYLSRRWFAAIASSCLAVSVQSAADAAHEGRQSFRDFRAENPEMERNSARKMFMQQFRNRLDANPADLSAARNHQVHLDTSTSGITSSAMSGQAERQLRIRIDQPRLANRSTQLIDNNTVNLKSGVNLDLSSPDRNITLGEKLFSDAASIQITVGGETKNVSAGSQVSAAEYVAVKQVLSGGGQQIALDTEGRANGGRMDLSAITAPNDKMRASNLVIPEHVTTYGDFSRSSEFKLTGDLDNFGSIIAVASKSNTRGGTIHADDITNHEGALISTTASKELRQSLGAKNGKLDLGVVADGELVNFGTITSSGNLSLTSGAGSIRNAGSVTSDKGNIALNGGVDNVLSVDNTEGRMVADDGAIILRAETYAGTANTYINGGDLISKEFQTNAGAGTVYVDVNKLTGEINGTGAAAHMEASTDVLTIGKICLTGDPTFRNTAGAITIGGDITVAEALTIVASGNIIISNNVDMAAQNASSGFDVTLLAGAEIVSAVGGADVASVPPLANNTTTLTLSGNGSATGGSVVFFGNNTINTRSSAAGNTNGGDVLLAAYKGSDEGSGYVAASSVSISTGGRGTGSNGDVLMIGGAGGSNAVTLGNINTAGGSGGNGSINAVTAQPVSTGGNITYDISGAKTSVASITSSSTLTATANLAVNGTINSAQHVNLRAGNILGTSSAASIIATGFGITLLSGGTMNLDGSMSSLGLTINAGGDLNQTSTSTIIAASNGFLTIGGTYNISGVTTSGAALSITTGALTMSAASALGSTTSNVTINSTGNIIGNVSTLVAADNGLVSLSSTNGNIGANAGLKFRVDANTLNATAFSGSIYISDIDAVNVTGATAANRLDITSVDGMSTTGLISADVINLRSTADAISMVANISAGTSASLKAVTDLIGDAAARLTAPQIYLTADSADIAGSTPLSYFQVDADNIVITAAIGNARVIDNNSLNFGGGSSFVGASLAALATGIISNSSPINAGSMALASVGSSVNIGAPLVASTQVLLQSVSSITNANINATITTPSLGVASSSGDIGTLVAPFTTNVAKLTAAAFNGNVYLNLTNPNVALNGLADVDFFVDATGNINIPTASSITADNVSLVSDGSVTSSGTGQIIAPVLTVFAGTTIGADLANRLSINSQTVFLETAGSGIFITDTSLTAVTLNSAVASGTIAFDATVSDLVSAASFSSGDIFLETGGVFNLSGNLTTTGALGLTSGGDLTNAQVTGTISTVGLLLGSSAGNVGTSALAPFVVTDAMADVVRVDAFGGGFVELQNTTEMAITESDGQELRINATGPMTIIGDVTATIGELVISNESGTLRVASGVSLTGERALSLLNTGTVKKTDKIIIEPNATLLTTAKTAGLGDVTISLGALSAKVLTKVPKNVVVTEIGGIVEFRGKSLKAQAPNNNITGQGANVLINNSLNAKTLTLGGGVNITADPPVSAGTPTFVRMAGTAYSALTDTQAFVGSESKLTNTIPVADTAALQLFDYASQIASQTGSLANRSGLLSSQALPEVEDDSYISGQPAQATVGGALYWHGEIGESANCAPIASRRLNGDTVRFNSDCKGLFIPAHDTTVELPNSTVKISAGGAVFLSVESDRVSVYNLHDAHKGSVSVVASGKAIKLAPGQHCTLANLQAARFCDINPIESVQHRAMSREKINDERIAFLSEFSLPSAISAMSPVKALLQSNHKDLRRIGNGLMKTTAVIMHLTSGSQPFQYHVRPRTVALAK